jgi:glycosyltransferase involved in cell wall biosynthesis
MGEARVGLPRAPPLVHVLGERPRERVRTEFDWRDLAQRYVELYADVLARRQRRTTA